VSGLPKLRIKLPYVNVSEEFCDLEQAKHRFNYGNEAFLIVVDGQLINSYEELLQLAELDCYKDKEFLDVLLLPIAGGG